MKKDSKWLLALLGFFALPSVSAYSYGFAYNVQNILDGMRQFADPILSASFGSYSTTEFFFVKLLVFILLFAIIRTAIRAVPKLGENNMVAVVISLVVSILAVRFMSETDIMKGILLPYGVLGIALTTILPFVIYFFFVHSSIENPAGRRVAFIFYLVVFGIIWFYRYDTLDDLSNYIFLGTMILALCLLFFDKQVRGYYGMSKIDSGIKEINKDQIVQLINKYQEAMNAYGATKDDKWLKHAEKIKERLHNLGYKFG